LAKAARLLVYLLIVWTPIPLGSNRPVLWAVNGLLASIALLLFALGELSADRRPSIDWRFVAWPMAALVVWALWMVVQILPGLPTSLTHPFLHEAAEAASGVSPTISASTSATWATLAEAVPVAFLAVVAMRMTTDARRGLFLLRLILATSVAVAIYGLVARYFGFRQIFVLEDGVDANYLTGTFTGRSSAASYFVVGLVVATALFAARVRDRLNPLDRRRNRILAAAEITEGGGIYLLASLVLAAALINSGSRGGLLAAIVAMPAVAYLSMRGVAAGRKVIGGAFVLVLGAILLIATVSSGVMSKRLAAGIDTGGRPLVYQDTIDMIADRPLLGHGAGAFADLFPLYHDGAPSYGVWYRAHDTYLQAAAELGLPVALLLLAALAGTLFVIFRETRTGPPSPVAVAALGAAVGVGFHSLIDFSVQIQAIGLTMSVLVGAGLGEALRRRSERSAKDEAAVAAGAPGRLETIYVTIPTAP
jgi:O-antigen ligase